MSRDPSVEQGLKALQTRLDTGIFRSPREQALDSSLDTLQGILGQILKRIDPNKFEVENINDAYKLTLALTGLKRAFSEDEKLKLDHEDVYEKACVELTDSFREAMKGHPELVDKIRKIVGETAEQVKNKPWAGRPKKYSKRDK